jgi:hypothetical protein
MTELRMQRGMTTRKMGVTQMVVSARRTRFQSGAILCLTAIIAGVGLGAVPAQAQARTVTVPRGRAGTIARQGYRRLGTVRPPPAGRAPTGTASRPFLAKSGAPIAGLAAFAATDFDSDPTQLAPPDTQVAVGPVFIGETVNDAFTIWSRTGSLVSSHDLNTFFSVPAGYRFEDPRLVYDTLSQRWLLSGWASDSSDDSNVYIGISGSSDPTAGWSIYRIAAYTAIVTDQPKIGVSDDKVVISWNDYINSESTFSGQETWVVQKSDLLAGGSIRYYQYVPDPSRYGVMPATSMTATSTEYLVYNNSCPSSMSVGSGSCTSGSPSLGVAAISGTPADNTVVWNESDPAISPTSDPPSAAQPAGPSIDTDDDRVLSAVWQNGSLWTTTNDACVVAGATHACMRLIDITTNTAPKVVLDTDLGLAGNDVYYPAITLDGAGNPYVVATMSSSSVDASVVVYGRSPRSGGFVHRIVWPGSGIYACSFCAPGDGGQSGNRWGDYSGAAIDPSNPSDVWVAGEYGTAIGGDDWGTAIGELTFAAPTVAHISPDRGTTAGGSSITVDGTNFSPDASVHFGTVASTSVSVSSSTALTATVPEAAAGTVDVTVTTAAGTSATSAADTYDFTGPPVPPSGTARGYWMVGASGRVYPFGSVHNYGNASTLGVTHLEPTPDRRGYWIVDAAGDVFAFGDAGWHGNAGALFAGETVSSLSATPTGDGYWLFTTRGRVLPFGDAHFYGDMSRVQLNGPVIDSIATPTGHGYYLIASDGGIFTFGDAHFYGSMGGHHLNEPVLGLVPTADNRGYWLVASDGGVFSFGDAHFHGSVAGHPLNRPVIGIVRYGNGYLMAASDGGIFDFSNRPFVGSLGSDPPAIAIVGFAATP